MIDIKDKKDCCGCEACVQRCPKACISFGEDAEGFRYPEVDATLCIDCGLCEKVCPVLNPRQPIEPLDTCAAINPDEAVRLQSSSGGVFTMLAQAVIARGGIVFGVGFNEQWEVVHKLAETEEALAEFLGSKYVQSRVGETFKQAEQCLKTGREVLFSGTPCQISGLKHFLRKDYPNLLTIDFICHGTPSPGIFRQYLEELKAKLSVGKSSGQYEISQVAFRNKSKGWKKFSFLLSLKRRDHVGVATYVQTLHKDPFLRGFLKNLFLRPSCHACPAKLLSSGSDITLADFWGAPRLMPQHDDDRGFSALTANTERGRQALSELSFKRYPLTYEQLKNTNSAFVHSTPLPPARAAFFLQSEESVTARIDRLAPIDHWKLLKMRIKAMIGKK